MTPAEALASAPSRSLRQAVFVEAESAAPPPAPSADAPNKSGGTASSAATAEKTRAATAVKSEPRRGLVPNEGPPRPEDVPSGRALIDIAGRPISSLTVNIGQKEGETPENFGRQQLGRMQAAPPDAVFDRPWPLLCFQWEAPDLAYRPLYFEEANLERYGYGVKYVRAAQPLISAGQFFTTVPILPYKAFAEPARTPVYTLGHYRPGSDVPYCPVWPPPSLAGAAAQAGVATGLIFVIP
jgi:hypothetical protein